MHNIENTLHALADNGNLRAIPADSTASSVIDLSSNDYLGLAEDRSLRAEFLAGLNADNFQPTSSASRLLSSRQTSYTRLEYRLAEVYGRPALLFNSGYHANTGLVSALGGRRTLFVADKLVHASIIDGLQLSGSRFERFRHNDYAHLEHLIKKYGPEYERIVIISESVFSMDGDYADISALAAAKKRHPDTLLYIDEAHGIGVCGPQGLGCVEASGLSGEVDIMVGTFGKALASSGAFAILSESLRQFMINRARSLIFSTSLPPLCAEWSLTTFNKALSMDSERLHLQNLASRLQQITGSKVCSHIQPLIVGDAQRAVALSAKLLDQGYKVLPIRTPTVPPGTERLRFSLSAALPLSTLDNLKISQVF